MIFLNSHNLVKKNDIFRNDWNKTLSWSFPQEFPLRLVHHYLCCCNCRYNYLNLSFIFLGFLLVFRFCFFLRQSICFVLCFPQICLQPCFVVLFFKDYKSFLFCFQNMSQFLWVFHFSYNYFPLLLTCPTAFFCCCCF